MLTRSQLLILTIMAALGGSFDGFLAVGIAMGDITLALINLGVIVALFSCAFLIASGSGGKPVNHLDLTYKHGQINPWVRQTNYKRAGDIKVGGEVLPEFK